MDVSSCCGVCVLGEMCHTFWHRTSLLAGAEAHSGKDWYNDGSYVCKWVWGGGCGSGSGMVYSTGAMWEWQWEWHGVQYRCHVELVLYVNVK